MTKRRAEFDIQDDDNGDQRLVEKSEYEGKINTQEEIAQRRILKIKGAKQLSDKKATGESVKFQLNAELDSNSDQSPQKEAPSFLNFQPTSSVPNIFSNKSIASTVSPSLLSLFGQNNNLNQQTPTQSENKDNAKPPAPEVNEDKKQEEKEERKNEKETPNRGIEEQSGKNEKSAQPAAAEPKPSLFSFATNSASLFSTSLPSNNSTGGLFGDLFSKNNGTAGGLFQNLKNTTNLFPNTTGLFSTGSTLNSDLINSKPQFSLLNPGAGTSDLKTFFNVSEANSAGFFKNDEEEEDEPKEESPNVDPTKSEGKFQYEATTEKLYSRNINKFKVNAQDPFEAGFISLEKALDSDIYYLIFRNSVKLILYRGFIFKKASKFSPLNNKNDCVSVTVFSEKKSGDEKKEGEEKKFKDKFNIDICKLMFQNEEDCRLFKEKFKDLCS